SLEAVELRAGERIVLTQKRVHDIDTTFERIRQKAAETLTVQGVRGDVQGGDGVHGASIEHLQKRRASGDTGDVEPGPQLIGGDRTDVIAEPPRSHHRAI